MNTQEFVTVRLQSGQRFHASVDAGTTIRVKSGVVRLTQPFHWLGDMAIRPTRIVAEGDDYRLACGGWMELEALHGQAEIVQHRQPSPVAAAVRALQLGLARFVAGLSGNAGFLKP